MSEQGPGTTISPALSTKLEEDFVSPLTAVRGVLEILRDFPNLESGDKQQFIENALVECARLEKGVVDLASTVYAAGQRAELKDGKENAQNEPGTYANRITIHEEHHSIEVDFSDFEFSNSSIVNEFYDDLENTVNQTGRKWYFVVNYKNCSIWPAAWVAFAHRGKKINVNYSLGTVRFSESLPNETAPLNQHSKEHNNSNMFDSFESALNYVDSIRDK